MASPIFLQVASTKGICTLHFVKIPFVRESLTARNSNVAEFLIFLIHLMPAMTTCGQQAEY